MDNMRQLRVLRLALFPTMKALPTRGFGVANFVRFGELRRSLPSQQHCIRKASTTAPPKTIVLDKPDKFRPPSHPQRISRRPPRQYPGPPLSEPELQAQKTKRYPHTFPNPGTRMFKFLTSFWVHVFITVGTLVLLAIVTATQTFLHNSPFGHLIPPIATFPFHPFSYIYECAAAWKMDVDYNSILVGEKRRNQLKEAQKQRLYRRAHGIEDLDMEEDQGVDVRGLVPWDDGLTKKERAAGGRDPALEGKMIHQVQMKGPNGEWRFVRDVVKEKFEVVDGVLVAKPELPEIGEDGQIIEPSRKKKLKRWLGIWE